MPESIDILQLRNAVQNGRLQWRRHALERMMERAISREGETCPLCGGKKVPGTTTFTVELGFGVFVVRNVPALVCSQCGADWLADNVAARLEGMVQEARKARRQVEVTLFAYQAA